jgi:hypothetical protein
MKNLYRSQSLKTVTTESARYRLDLVGVEEVSWDRGGTDQAGSCERSNKLLGSIKYEEFLD